PIQQEYEHICIESETAYAYDEFYDDYAPIEHQFTFALDPMEFRQESWSVNPDDLDEIDVDATFQPSAESPGHVAETDEEDSIVTLYPGRSCDDNPRCEEDIMLEKPFSYANQREKVVLHRLPFDDYDEAKEEFKEKLQSTTSHEDWIPDRHNGLHYIIEQGDDKAIKLAREDAVLQFSRFHDGESIHVGLIMDDEIDSAFMELVLSKLSEILLRNDLTSNRLVASNSLELPDYLPEDYDHEYPEETHLDIQMFYGIQGTVHDMVTQYRSGGISDPEETDGESVPEDD
ncbi:MAG: hypothetical protein ACLFTR_01675, partial [Candidatus Woesearchaeota archaeon]